MRTVESSFITVADAARLLGRSEIVVYQLIQVHRLEHIQSAGAVLVSAEHLLRAAGPR